MAPEEGRVTQASGGPATGCPAEGVKVGRASVWMSYVPWTKICGTETAVWKKSERNSKLALSQPTVVDRGTSRAQGGGGKQSLSVIFTVFLR